MSDDVDALATRDADAQESSRQPAGNDPEFVLFVALIAAFIPMMPALASGHFPEKLALGLAVSGLTLWAIRIFSAVGPISRWHAMIARLREYRQQGRALRIAAVIAALTAAVAAGSLLDRYVLRQPCCSAPPTVSIVTPTSTLGCQAAGPQCQFVVTGRSARATAGLQIFVLVFPLSPNGYGWYLQNQPASIGGNGDWKQSPSYLGSASTPVHGGDTLQIEAVLVHADATYNGTRLSVLSPGTIISDPGQIRGIVSHSATITLRVLR